LVLDSLLDAVWFYERRAEVARRLDDVVARQPLRSLEHVPERWTAVPQRHLYFRIAELYAMAGQPEKARRILAQYAADVRDTAQVRLERSAHDHALGEIALAERKYDDAIRAFQRADTASDGWPVECNACSLPRLARAYDLAEKPDLALATFEAYVAATWPWRMGDIDYMYLADAYKRLGELYEAKGNREKAIEYHRRFIQLWKDADPELRPKVDMARQRLARLELTERARQ
jgi:tetratricopeptide (TPR) repeat protein